MVIISCSGKLHAFALAEQMERLGMLDDFYNTYAYQKNIFWRRWVRRVDREQIPAGKIHTNILLAFPVKLWQAKAYIWNNLFDKWVAGRVSKKPGKVFIGWSGMSLHAMRAAKKKGMITILERGSSHIQYQDKILGEEFARFGKSFSVHDAVIKKELQEYQEADYISIPSAFVERSFLQYGIPGSKLIVNAYGASKLFKPETVPDAEKRKFRILYLGSLSIRKGLYYLFQAIEMLGLPIDAYEVWFIGGVQEELKATIDKYSKPNWRFLGHVNHYDLPGYLSQCDLAVQPSLEEGLSMVIPQMMSCGLPVIITPNTGAESMVQEGVNGYIVPIRDPQAIAEKIIYLYNNRQELEQMKKAAARVIDEGFAWNDYGDRYANAILKIVNNKK